MDLDKVFKFNGYQKVPGFFNVNHNGGVSVIIDGHQIIIKTVFFIKRRFSIYDIKKILYGKTCFEIPFVGLVINSNGKEIIHLFTVGLDLFTLKVNTLDRFLNEFKEKVPIQKVEDKIITGKSLIQYLNN